MTEKIDRASIEPEKRTLNEEIAFLVKSGGKKGYLTTDEVSEALVLYCDASSDDIDNAYEELAKNNVLVVGEEPSDAEEFFYRGEDSTRTYLKALGDRKSVV